jgi:carbon monoxide dehydrogenase subunit G
LIHRDQGADVRFRIEQTSAATPQQLYEVLLDIEHWPDWMPGVRRAEWEKRGAPGTEVGGVRRFGAPGLAIREEVLSGQPPGHQSYSIISGLPVKNHRGDVRIVDRPGGSQVNWDVAFESRIPLLGSFLRLILESTIRKGASALAIEAERRVGRMGF